jgi:hypothetical protein
MLRDVGATKMPAVVRRLPRSARIGEGGGRGRTAGWRGARPDVVRRERRGNFRAFRGAGCPGEGAWPRVACGLGRHDGADAEGGRRRRNARARDVAARSTLWLDNVSLCPYLNVKISKILNRSA